MAMYKNALSEGIFKKDDNITTMGKETAKQYAFTLDRILSANNNSCQLTDIICTPCNTLFKYEVYNYSTMFSRIKRLEKEIPLFLDVPKVEINFLPKESGFSINVPNTNRQTIPIGNLIFSPKFLATKKNSTFVVGIDEQNDVVTMDFDNIAHLLVAGTTGSGKSTFLKLMISSIMANAQINTVKFVLVDPKMVEFAKFKNCTNFLHQPIINSKWETIRMLWDMVDEMETRFKILEQNNVENINQFNALKAPLNEVMTRIIIVIDELGDVMLSSKKEVEPRLVKLAQKGRAAGIHLVCATQRPDANIVTGLLKANFQTKISFKVSTATNSRVILDNKGAEDLLGKGDGLYTDNNTNMLKRFQCGYVSDTEINELVDYIQNRAITI